MIARRLIYFIVTAFVAGNLIFIFIKYTSDKNISNLIDDNEKLLNEFKVSSRLKTLENDVVLADNKIKKVVGARNANSIVAVEMQLSKIRSDLDTLQMVTGDRGSEEYIDQLDVLVQQKLKLDHEILDAYKSQGKKTAEVLIAAKEEKNRTDSILMLTQKINQLRQKLLSNVTQSIDNSVKKAERLDFFLIVFVLVSAAVLFWYVVNTIRTQNRLIQQVVSSEQKVKEAAEVKQNFLANMSHEIRTPMNAILGFTNLLQRKHLDKESMLYVQTIQRSGENLLSIINDILDLSKIEAGMMRIEIAPFSMRGLVHSIETLFKTKADEKGIRLFTQVEESLPDTLEGDATRLTQILINLIGNAIKFTMNGEISISVKNGEHKGDTLMVGIEVSDTGIGIEEEKLNHIFDRFQQADDAVTRKYGGTGLGLSIVKELVALQNGTIRAETEPGKGTTFYLEIPYKISRSQIPPETNSFTQPTTDLGTLQNVHILVAEDNEVNQTLLQHLFQNWQVNFDIANNGAEAIEKLKTNKFDLILMDIQMPQMDGYTSTQKIRNELKISTPVIAMTAHAMVGEREKCLSYGMNEYISKPIREVQLWNLITQFLPLKTRISSKAEIADEKVATDYQYIDLAYMKDVSAGNKTYEKEVTTQFVEGIPKQLKLLEEAWHNREIDSLKQTAHNLKTTVSVMGLNETLEPYLDAIEYSEPGQQNVQENIENIQRICLNALPEAQHFLSSITDNVPSK